MSETKPVSLGHPCIGKTYEIEGTLWKVASVHMAGSSLWAWIVNLKNKMDQRRISVEELTVPC